MKHYFTIQTNKIILITGAIIGLFYGCLIPFMPSILSSFIGQEGLNYVTLARCAALVSAAMGIGYLVASVDPAKNWTIVLVGFLGNIAFSLYFIISFIFGTINTSLDIFLFINCLIWIVPFYYILVACYEEYILEDSSPKRFHDLIKLVRTNQGDTILNLSEKNDVLLVFIRHFGCMFCRETVSELSKLSKKIEERKLKLVFVHMSDPDFGDQFFARYYDQPVAHISDPTRTLFRSFGLNRAHFDQMFGLRIQTKAIWSGFIKGHGVGAFEGDILQLGGVFILSKGQVIFEKKALASSDIFDFSTVPQ